MICFYCFAFTHCISREALILTAFLQFVIVPHLYHHIAFSIRVSTYFLLET